MVNSTPLRLDCRGLTGSKLFIRVSMSIEILGNGELMEIEATDPGFLTALDEWIDTVPHELLEAQDDGEIRRALLRKAR